MIHSARSLHVHCVITFSDTSIHTMCTRIEGSASGGLVNNVLGCEGSQSGRCFFGTMPVYATLKNYIHNRRDCTRLFLYLRMSTDQQEQSISAQRDELHRYAKRQGYVITDEYIDEAISGDNTQKRAGFLRMRDDAVSGKFSLVLCWDQDRFGISCCGF